MRSDPKAQKRAQKTVFSSRYGTVRIYTRRHINGCLFKGPDEQHCPCPKWIYANPKAGKPFRNAAGTPSFSEACDVAQNVLRGFDPDICAARLIAKPAPGISIDAALERYFGVLEGRKLSAAYLAGVGKLFLRRKPRRDGKKNNRPEVMNTSFCDFLDRANLTAIEPITRMEQITSDTLIDWQSTWRSNDMTSKCWRTMARSFFRWSLDRAYLKQMPAFDRGAQLVAGNRCGSFTDEQFTRLMQALPFYPLSNKLPSSYAARLGAFLEAGRWGGMALCDIVLFSPALNLSHDHVLSYRRHKNRKKKNSPIAVVALMPEIAKRLRSVPLEPEARADQPFRFEGMTLIQNCAIWRKRFQALCAFVGITEIETEVGTRRQPHPHMLRDTCAIDAITRGVKLENVAKMLGHANTAMTQRSYLFWIQKRTDHCIADQRAALAGAQVPPVPTDDRSTGGNALRLPLIH
jgi:integrase